MSLPGSLLYQLWHRPISAAVQSWREGGPHQRRLTEYGRNEMETAAASLQPLMPSRGLPLPIEFLTGGRFWYQTAFCLTSLARATPRPIAPRIVDDGSLTSAQIDHLRVLCPLLSIDSAATIKERLDHFLPTNQYPTLRAHRQVFPLLKKLTDIHVGQTGWRLFLDSDLLFFRSPEFLISWLDTRDSISAPARPLHARDLTNAYGYSLHLLANVAGRPVPHKVNTGLLGLRSDAINWERLEYACATLLERGGPQYYLEQALVAVLLAGQDCDVPPPEDYVLLPRPPEALTCATVMHHYVAESKRWYFQHNWRRFAQPSS